MISYCIAITGFALCYRLIFSTCILEHKIRKFVDTILCFCILDKFDHNGLAMYEAKKLNQ
jgi:hypothetical protein